MKTVVLACIIAYLLDPVVGFFQREYQKFYELSIRPFRDKFFPKTNAKSKTESNNKSRKGFYYEQSESVTAYETRTAGTLICYALIILIFSAIGYFVADRIGNTDINVLAEKAVAAINGFSERFAQFQIQLAEWGVFDYIYEYTNSIVNSLAKLAGDITNNLIASLKSTGMLILDLLIAMVIAFYFLRDKAMILGKMNELFDRLVPWRFGRRIKVILKDINEILTGYIRGEITDAFIIAVLASAVLWLVRLDYAIIIGVMTGLANLIPYFGGFFGIIVSVVVALINGKPLQAVYATIGLSVLQQFDGMYLVPKIIGESVRLNPVLVIISLSIGGGLFGILGMIFAVPVCAIIKMLIYRFAAYRQNVEHNKFSG